MKNEKVLFIVSVFVMALFILFVVLSYSAHAFSESSFKNRINCRECTYSTNVYTSVYDGHKDRYDEDALRNDDEVLVASAKHESRDIRGTKEVSVTAVPEEETEVVVVDIGKMSYTISEE